jgi:hypothetical protein
MVAEREGRCANYFPYPNLQAFHANDAAAGTNAGTNEKRKPPPTAIRTYGKLDYMRRAQADLFACQLDSLITVHHTGSTVSLHTVPRSGSNLSGSFG